MLKDNEERCLSSKGIKSLNNVSMLDMFMHIKRLLSSYNRECPHGYKSRVSCLSLCYYNKTIKVEIKNFLIDFLW
jgi:hypothetical protein